MRPNESRGSGGRRSGRGQRRSSRSRADDARPRPNPPARKTFWEKLLAFFKSKSPASKGSQPEAAKSPRNDSGSTRKPEAVEVTSSKLYVGNLSYDATESDLFELFKGVGVVKNAEIVSHKYNEKSKGFAFVTMSSIDEAKRAVLELHDKEFMGRKLVVSGAKISDREPNYRG